MYFKLISIGFLAIFISCQSSNVEEELVTKPNILLLLADDMGYSDLGCFGGEITTPNLDQLAANGIRFTHFYNAARCCPTRASLLTGLYPHQAGMGGMVKHQPTDTGYAYQGYLNKTCLTIAEALKPAGYRSYISGKWHVGEFKGTWPLDRGFDRYYGLISGVMNYWNIHKGKNKTIKRTFLRDNEIINDEIQGGIYATNAYTEEAIHFLNTHFEENADQPFFLYLAHQAPHWPIHAPDSMIRKYIPLYQSGWDTLRKDRLHRMKSLGIIPKDQALSPIDSLSADWKQLTEAQKDTMVQKMATYAAMIDIMDQNIGRVVNQLKNLDAFENTLILFLSDNGASHESGPLGHNFRPDLTGPIGSEDSYHSYGLSWANASNTPYRKFKSTTFEGGTSTPMIMHWGAGISEKGVIKNTRAHIIDLLPTFLELAQTTYPKTYNEHKIQPLEGKSLVPILQNSTQEIRNETEPLFWEHEGNKAVLKGPWKIVQRSKNPYWSLYNIQNDRIEMEDLSDQFPKIKSELIAEYESWAKRVKVQ